MRCFPNGSYIQKDLDTRTVQYCLEMTLLLAKQLEVRMFFRSIMSVKDFIVKKPVVLRQSYMSGICMEPDFQHVVRVCSVCIMRTRLGACKMGCLHSLCQSYSDRGGSWKSSACKGTKAHEGTVFLKDNAANQSLTMSEL